MSFQIVTEKFQGPLHTLLALIEKRKLHISEISLASIADEFVAYMQQQNLNYAEITSFVVITSTLLLIKVKSILPAVELTPEESVSIDDLTERLRKYAIIKDYTDKLSKNIDTVGWYERPESILYTSKDPLFIPDDQIHIGGLIEILRDVLQSVPVLEKNEQATIVSTVRIEDVIARFEKLVTQGNVSWQGAIMSRYYASTNDKEKKGAKVEIVVSFLAMLEMFKKGIVHVVQNNNFTDIEITTTDGGITH